MVVRQLTCRLVGELSRQADFLDLGALRKLFDCYFLQCGIVGRLPVSHLDVVEHADGTIDRMAKYGEDPSLFRGREQLVDFVEEPCHDGVR